MSGPTNRHKVSNATERSKNKCFHLLVVCTSRRTQPLYSHFNSNKNIHPTKSHIISCGSANQSSNQLKWYHVIFLHSIFVHFAFYETVWLVHVWRAVHTYIWLQCVYGWRVYVHKWYCWKIIFWDMETMSAGYNSSAFGCLVAMCGWMLYIFRSKNSSFPFETFGFWTSK